MSHLVKLVKMVECKFCHQEVEWFEYNDTDPSHYKPNGSPKKYAINVATGRQDRCWWEDRERQQKRVTGGGGQSSSYSPSKSYKKTNPVAPPQRARSPYDSFADPSHNNTSKRFECYKCHRPIMLLPSMVGANGKRIPLDPPMNEGDIPQPHQCPMKQQYQNPQQPTRQQPYQNQSRPAEEGSLTTLSSGSKPQFGHEIPIPIPEEHAGENEFAVEEEVVEEVEGDENNTGGVDPDTPAADSSSTVSALDAHQFELDERARQVNRARITNFTTTHRQYIR